MPKDAPHFAAHLRSTLGPFRNSIRGYRLRADLTQHELAARLGLRDGRTISNWELGWHLPRITNVLRLAKELGTLVESLYWDTYAPNAPRTAGEYDHDFPTGKGSVTLDPAAILRRRYGRATKRVRAYDRIRLYTAIAQEIRARRREARLTPDQLGRRIGRSRTAVLRLEQDDYHHGDALPTLLRIAATLDLRVEVRLVPRRGRDDRG